MGCKVDKQTQVFVSDHKEKSKYFGIDYKSIKERVKGKEKVDQKHVR